MNRLINGQILFFTAKDAKIAKIIKAFSPLRPLRSLRLDKFCQSTSINREEKKLSRSTYIYKTAVGHHHPR